MQKTAIPILCLALIMACPLSGLAFERLSPGEMKSVMGQAGINSETTVETAAISPSETDALRSQRANIPALNNTETSRSFSRGAGISIAIDDVVLLITSMPDITFWDTDGY